LPSKLKRSSKSVEPMKIVLLLSFLTLSVLVSATDYYVKNGGNDLATGTTDATAWATIQKVNSFAFKPGDRILFKRGDTWRIITESGNLNCKSGSSSGDVFYTSYGTGANPLILGSKQENSQSDWTSAGTNLWRNSDASFTIDVGNIVFNNETSSAVRVSSLSDVNSQGKYYYDATNNYITLFSNGNPAVFYSNIECVLRINPSNIQIPGGYHHITIDGLDIRYSGRIGINMSHAAYNITIRNCNVSWIGGSLDGTGRLGNGIQLWGSGTNILIEKNRVENIFDAGISPQWWSETSNVTISNFVVRNNIISKCDLSSLEFVWAVPGGTVSGLHFQNNTCVNAGGGWAYDQRWGSMTSSAGTHIRAADGSNITFSNCFIRNNIFSVSKRPMLYCQQPWTMTEFTYDNNLYNVDVMARVSITYYTTLAQWQALSNKDSNSKSINPGFVGSTDYHLLTTSPAINSGVNVGYSDDFDGNPIIGNPDIGAFEKQLVTGAPPTYSSSAVENSNPSLLVLNYDLSLANITPSASAFAVLVNSAVRNVSSLTVSGTKVQLTLSVPIVFGDVVTVAYTKPATNPLQTPSGEQAASISAKSVTNNVLPPSPLYISSVIENSNASNLEMNFSLPLTNIVPAASAFTIMVNSVTRSVTTVIISGNKVHLTLSSPVVYGDVATVSYVKPAFNPLQTTSGGQVATIVAQTVTNNVSPLNPVYLSSSISNATPSVLDMTYSLTLANILPVATAFTILVNSVARTVNSVAISGTKVSLTLASPVVYGNVITVAYNKPTSNPLQTTSGGEAATISAQTVTNNVAPINPVYVSSGIANATPSILEMTYNPTLANIVPAATSFTVLVNSVARTVNSVAISGTKVSLTLSSPVVYGNIITVAYNKPSANPLQTISGGEAATIAAQSVTNNVAPINPVYVSSVIENLTPAILDITYNLTLANVIPSSSAFSVKVNSGVRGINSVAIIGNKVRLTLASAVLFNDLITITYTKPATNQLQTSLGGIATNVGPMPVTNNCQDPAKANLSPTIVLNYETSSFAGFVNEIDASGSYDQNNDALSYEWIVPNGVTVSSTSGSRIKYLSPNVITDQVIEFQLKVNDGITIKSAIIPININAYKPELDLARISATEASNYKSPDYPKNVADGNITSKWSVEGDNQWLLISLAESFKISHLNLAFLTGQKFSSYFDVYASKDNLVWEPIIIGAASCNFSGDQQVFDFPVSKTDIEYSYLKFVGHGNSLNTWNYISEVKIFGSLQQNLSTAETGNEIVIYPNPAQDYFNISIEGSGIEPDQLRIINSYGKVVLDKRLQQGLFRVNLPGNIKSGIYLIELRSGGLIVDAQQLIVNR